MSKCRCGNVVELFEVRCQTCKESIRADYEASVRHLRDAGRLGFMPANEVERQVHDQRRKGKQWGRSGF